MGVFGVNLMGIIFEDDSNFGLFYFISFVAFVYYVGNTTLGCKPYAMMALWLDIPAPSLEFFEEQDKIALSLAVYHVHDVLENAKSLDIATYVQEKDGTVMTLIDHKNSVDVADADANADDPANHDKNHQETKQVYVK